MVTATLIRVKFPANAQSVFGTLTQAATFDVLYTDDWFPLVFGFGDLEPYNNQFEDNNLETMNLIMNLGSLFIVFGLHAI
jgi:hypothetical protein